MRYLHLVGLALLFPTAACFAGAHEPPAPAPAATTVPAVELGCPYVEPADPAHASYRVTLSFLVLTDGTVAPSTVKVVQDHFDTDRQSLIKRAMQIAGGCTFNPALSGGKPVESTVTKHFYFNED